MKRFTRDYWLQMWASRMAMFLMLFIPATLLVWFIFGIGNWQFDPAEWSENSKIGMAFADALISAFCLTAAVLSDVNLLGNEESSN